MAGEAPSAMGEGGGGTLGGGGGAGNVLPRSKYAPRIVPLNGPAVLLVDLGSDPVGMLDELELLPAPRPLLLVAGPQEDSRLILRAMRLGAREFFSPHPAEDALRSAVERKRGASA